jgi:outer membrane protein OmpA-like peptidoglycan-associated protein/ABC-type nitrate/sulfonate/bicarbonate transport system substrate-binding protein
VTSTAVRSRPRGRPGPALTIGLPVLAALAIGYWGYPWLKPKLQGEGAPQAAAIVPATGAPAPGAPVTFRVAADPWSGYSTFRNEPRFAGALAKHGVTVQYLDEEKYYDQNERMRALAAGEIDIALTTLDAFLQLGSKHKVDGRFPGVILFGIDESAGGDAIFLAKGRSSFDDVKPTDKVCFSTATPSEHLWDFASLSFARLGDNLSQDNGVVAKDCWTKLNQDQVQVAVLWQPYTALAERAGYAKVFATGGQADDVILDVFVVGRKVLDAHREQLTNLTASYFQTIDDFQRDRAQHGEFIRRDCGEDCAGDPSLGQAVISGIDFLTFEENLCLWFGQCGVPNKLNSRVGKTGRLLIAKGKLSAEELPDPATIIDDSVVKAIKEQRISAARLAAEVSGPETKVELPTFSVRDPSYQYAAQKVDARAGVGTLQLPNVMFRDGAYALDADAKAIVAGIAEQLASFPALCVRVTGFTSSTGNPKANRQLSQFRAAAIAAELNRINPDAFPMTRFQLRGMSSAAPVLNNGAEDVRASRRTEFTLFNCGTQTP